MSDEDFSNGAESEGVKSLRKALEKAQADATAKDELLAGLLKKDRTRNIADKLATLGAKPGLAEFVPSDVEVDGLVAWLTEKADLFGFKPASEPPANAEEAAAQQRISGFSTELPEGDSNDPDMKAVLGTTSVAELTKLIYDRQAGAR